MNENRTNDYRNRKNQRFLIILLILFILGLIFASFSGRDRNENNYTSLDGNIYADGENGEGYANIENINIHSYAVLNEATTEVLVSFLDVGQGDSILIQTENNVVLIDASWDRYSYRIIEYLGKYDIEFIDVVIATHPHADHIGGFPAVFEVFEVGTVYKPIAQHTTLTYFNFIESIIGNDIPISIISAGYEFELDGVIFSVVAPNSEGHGNLNNYSVVLHMQHYDVSFLFAGDAEVFSEVEMLLKDRHMAADVLKVGHHGSRTSTTPSFLKAVDPTYAVIQVGRGNQYGHPHNVVIDLLYDFGVVVYRTDIHGTVQMVSDGISIWTRTERR